MRPAGSHRNRSSSWSTIRSALVFLTLFATVLITWLPDVSGPSLMQRGDVLLLLVFLGIVVAFTVEPPESARRRRAARSWWPRLGQVVRRRK
jgi:peptidoglycan/LPS O-acetylase OafA/YrhL